MNENLKSNFVPQNEEEAIQTVLARLEQMHLCILNDDNSEPRLEHLPRNPDLKPWEQMVKWMPTVCDFENYTLRIQRAENLKDEHLERWETRLQEWQTRLNKTQTEVNLMGAKILPFVPQLEAVLRALKEA